MKKFLSAALLAIMMLLVAERCHAQVLVFRYRLTSRVSETADGVSRGSGGPSTLSALMMLDLDTDYVVEANENADRQWATPRIQLNEKPRSGTKTAEYSFRADDDRNSDSLAAWRQIKFEFYGKNDAKFYLFYQDFDDYGAFGVDHGSFSCNGLCKLGVNIGGGRTSSVPRDFMATQKRGDNKEFKSFVFSVKYDATLTTAVNDYLSANNIRSTKGARVSVSIPAATDWLINTYLPPRYPAVFPYSSAD